MEDELFNELVASVKEAKQIMNNEIKPSRVFEYPDPDVKGIRQKLGLTQAIFAAFLGVSRKTIQIWEQGIRNPQGAARSLLFIASKEPVATMRALHG